jgi:RNase P subunit RPR2
MRITIAQLHEAKVVDLGPTHWWACPNCRRTIGQIVGARLIVIVRGRQMTFPLMDGMTQTCPNCGQESRYESS